MSDRYYTDAIADADSVAELDDLITEVETDLAEADDDESDGPGDYLSAAREYLDGLGFSGKLRELQG